MPKVTRDYATVSTIVDTFTKFLVLPKPQFTVEPVVLIGQENLRVLSAGTQINTDFLLGVFSGVPLRPIWTPPEALSIATTILQSQ